MIPNDTGSGMLIHIMDGIDFQKQNTDPAVSESQIVDLKLGDVKICLMSVYRSPNSITEKNSRLSEKITTLGESDRKMIILGDSITIKSTGKRLVVTLKKIVRKLFFLR